MEEGYSRAESHFLEPEDNRGGKVRDNLKTERRTELKSAAQILTLLLNQLGS